MSACTQKTPNLRCGFLKRRLTNTPRRYRLANGQLSSLYAPSPSFRSFGAASVMLYCSAPPASLSTPLRPSVRYPSIGQAVNIVYLRALCDDLKILHIFDQTSTVFEVRLVFYNGAFSVSVSPPDATAKPMTGSHHFIPPRQVSACVIIFADTVDALTAKFAV